jgi:Major Facilitator Superfamily
MKVSRVFGAEPLAALTRVHAVSTAADACITVSLAGSLFFSISVDAARPRLALYLALTLAPFAIVAPLIGPVTDRFRGSPAGFIAFTGQGRAILALFIAIDIRSPLLYPESFGVLVLGRSYSIVKRALVPELVPNDRELVAANARLSRIGSAAGALGGAVAVALFQLGGPTTVLRVAAVLHLVGSALALRLPRTQVRATPEPTAERVEQAATEQRLRASRFVMTALRCATGLLTFVVAFALKRSGEPLATFGLIALAATLASFAGTFVSPVLRRHVVDEHVILGACATLAVAGSIVALFQHGVAGMLIATATLGIAASAARHAFDSLLQQNTDQRQRSRAFARAEALLEVAWVVGALVPTVLNLELAPGYVTVVALGCASLLELFRSGRHRMSVPAG